MAKKIFDLGGIHKTVDSAAANPIGIDWSFTRTVNPKGLSLNAVEIDINDWMPHGMAQLRTDSSGRRRLTMSAQTYHDLGRVLDHRLPELETEPLQTEPAPELPLADLADVVREQL